MQSRGWNYRKSNGCHNVKSASTLKLGNKCLYAKFRPQMLNDYKSILVLLTRNKLTLRCKFKFPLINPSPLSPLPHPSEREILMTGNKNLK